MNQRKTKLFQFIGATTEITDKCLNVTWCCSAHRQHMTSVIISMNEEVVSFVSKHKEDLNTLPPEFEQMIDTFLPILAEFDKAIDKIDQGMLNLDATMPHGGVA